MSLKGSMANRLSYSLDDSAAAVFRAMGSGLFCMGVRRFTRLASAFSKKFENHCHMVATYHAYYNFCRVHQTLRVTPAMEAGLADHVWTVEELVGLLASKEQPAAA